MIQYNDYEEYGNSFRTPRAYRPDGGPANNSSGMPDENGEQPKPEGRPKAPEQANDAGGSQVAQPQQVQPVPTFRQLQAQGYARPPMPNPTGAPMGFNGGNADTPFGGGKPGPGQSAGGGGIENQLRNQWQGYQGGGDFRYQTPQIDAPGAFQGQGFGGQYNPYQTPDTSMTGQFGGQGGQGGQVDQATGQSVLQGLQNPSRWDNDLIKQNYSSLAGQIDDEYNKKDLDLQGSLARRGLGATGDTTIGSNDARYQNLQRRSAKSDALQNIMTQAANTQAQDRAQAVSAGMGYGGQQFGQGLQTYGANANTNQQNFGQRLQAAQFGAGEAGNAYDRSFARDQYNTGLGQQGYQNRMEGARFNADQGQQQYQNQANSYAMNQGNNQQNFNQRQALLNNYLGYGQQSFQNQRATAQDRQAQQQQEYENLLKMLGY